MNISTIYLSLVTSFMIFVFIYTLKNNKEKSYANPFFIFLGYIFFYLVIPSFFTLEFRHYYHWTYTNDDIFYANILIANVSLIISLMVLKFNKVRLQKFKNRYKSSIIIKIIWFLVLIYLLFIFFIKYKSGNLFFTENYLGATDIYKLKNMAYLLVTISIIYFFEVKKFYVFMPNILIIILDLLTGSRTIAMIAFVPIFIAYSFYKQKTYMIHIGLIISLMVTVGTLRSSIDTGTLGVPTHIKALGEFRETYLTLPIMISNDEFVEKGDFIAFLNSIVSPLIYPLREELGNTFLRPGKYASKLIGRGYGLGSNLITEAIFYGYWYLVFVLFSVIGILLWVQRTIQKIPILYSVIFISYIIIFSRLAIREGFLTNVSAMIFVLLIYSFPFILLNKYLKKITLRKRK